MIFLSWKSPTFILYKTIWRPIPQALPLIIDYFLFSCTHTLPPPLVSTCRSIYKPMHGTHIPSYLPYHYAYHILSQLTYHTMQSIKARASLTLCKTFRHTLAFGISAWRACHVRLHWFSVRSISVIENPC